MNQSYGNPAIRPDPRLAARMMRAYNDELNQVITYTYQHLLTEGLDNEASELFLTLSREDMTHFHTLGRLVRALGLHHREVALLLAQLTLHAPLLLAQLVSLGVLLRVLWLALQRGESGNECHG